MIELQNGRVKSACYNPPSIAIVACNRGVKIMQHNRQSLLYPLSIQVVLLLSVFLNLTGSISSAEIGPHIELSRPVRFWEFLPTVGTKAALFGRESGQFEAWVYPLKILRNFHVLIHTGGRVIPAETLARTLTVRPESSTILYAGDTFSIREVMFVPVHESGAVIRFDVESSDPLELEAVFERDFQLEWPAAIGGTFGQWDPTLNAFYLGEEQKKFAAFIGSPAAASPQEDYVTNSSSSPQSSMLLGSIQGRATKIVVIAGSVAGRDEAEKTYRKLTSSHEQLLSESADYYRNYLEHTVGLELPDAQLQQAYDWSRVSVLQGMVESPYLGTGLVAGYRTSGNDQRPGFSWFFGRDSLWTDLALDSAGDFANTRTALDFITKFQRVDGKIPHEIAQTASLVDWFKNFPYGFASADATPLFIITMNDYVKQSGDVNFAKQKWDNIARGYEFLRSTYDEREFPKNIGIGHGWVEGGPLLPVKTELYQSALGVEALRALWDLARLTGRRDDAVKFEQAFHRQEPALNQAFWSPEKNVYAFALDQNNKREETPSVLATVPMWFGLFDEDKSNRMIDELAKPDHQTDWGMRIISSQDPRYGAGGYHFGSVWPLFTGWASVGEYRYHRAIPAYENLRANALMTLDGSLGHVTEVLSGDYYQTLSTASPHQIWSAAMVVSPMLRGMLGLNADAFTGELTLAPHLPADWSSFSARNVQVGNSAVTFAYKRTLDTISLDAQRLGDSTVLLNFEPAISLRAEVASAEIDGRRLPFHILNNINDQHVAVHVPVGTVASKLRIHLRKDVDFSVNTNLPLLGSPSREAHVVSESWSANRDSVLLEVVGPLSSVLSLQIRNPDEIASVENGTLVNHGDGTGELRVSLFPDAKTNEATLGVKIHFKASDPQSHKASK